MMEWLTEQFSNPYVMIALLMPFGCGDDDSEAFPCDCSSGQICQKGGHTALEGTKTVADILIHIQNQPPCSTINDSNTGHLYKRLVQTRSFQRTLFRHLTSAITHFR